MLAYMQVLAGMHECLQEAARRCGKEFAGKQEDKSLRSYAVSLLEQGLGKTEVLEETDETTKETADTYSVDDNELAVHVNINGDSTTGKVDFYA